MWKIPKGTCDLIKDEYDNTHILIKTIEDEFIKHGGEPLETPIFERKDVLFGKYGEEAESKLIYNLADEGGELLALRYDLTIPFIRYLKENGVQNMRRYTIGKVYRRDQPNKNQGRLREFYQADFDIVGEKQDNMIAEGMLLKIACNILNKYNLEYSIYINDINNLKTLITEELEYKGEWRKLCPIIDKLDKQSFDSLKIEFLEVDPNLNINKLEQLLQSIDPFNTETKQSFNALKEYANINGFSDKLIFLNSLARGLDYYTGFIWEIKIKNCISSIIAGGRYDGIINRPIVGISFGITRMIKLLKIQHADYKIPTYYVTTIGNITILEKLTIINKLENKLPNAKLLYSLSNEQKKLTKILSTDCINCDYCVIIGESEMHNNKVIIKNLRTREQSVIDI